MNNGPERLENPRLQLKLSSPPIVLNGGPNVLALDRIKWRLRVAELCRKKPSHSSVIRQECKSRPELRDRAFQDTTKVRILNEVPLILIECFILSSSQVA